MDNPQKQVRHRIPVVDFVPAQIKKGNKGNWRIEFYVPDPAKSLTKLKRIQRRVRPMNNLKERERFAKRMCFEVNRKLERGWNPFIEMEAPNSFALLKDVANQFLNNTAKQVKDGSLRKDTLRSYTSYLKNLEDYIHNIGETNLFCLKFNRQLVNAFLDHVYYERDNSPRTYNNYVSFLNTFAKYMLKKEVISKNPVEGIEKKRVGEKKRKYIPETEIKRIFEYLNAEDLFFATACGMIYYELVRRTEMSKMRVGDIDLKNRVITIRSEVSKNKRTQYITILEEFIPMLVAHIKTANNNDFLFSVNEFKPGKEQIEPKAFTDRWTRTRNVLGIDKKYQLYSLKDTGITNLLRAGVPAIHVRDHARHHDIAMTQKYTPMNTGVSSEFLDGKLKV